MGEYEPNDSRNVTLGSGSTSIEPERTGPREGETRRQSEQGEAHDGSVRSELQQEGESADYASIGQVGELSEAPDERARADAQRPLYQPSND